MPAPSPFLPVVLIAALAAPPLAHAGNVVSKLTGGKLALTGDDASNELTIDQVGLPADSLRVTPGVGTTVDGSATPQVFASATGSLKVTFGAQADVLLIQGTTLAGALDIKAGGGRDDLTIDTSTIAGAVKIDLGEGSDALAICNTNLGAKITVKAGRETAAQPVDPDCPSIPSGPFPFEGSIVRIGKSSLAGDLGFTGGAGGSALLLHDSQVTGKVKMKGPDTGLVAAADVAVGKDVAIDLGISSTNQTFQVTAPSGATAQVQTSGNGIVMAGLQIGGKLTVDAGNGGVAICEANVAKDLVLKFAAAGASATSHAVTAGGLPLTQFTLGTGSAAVLLDIDVGGKLDTKFAGTPIAFHRLGVGIATIIKSWKTTFGKGGGAIAGGLIATQTFAFKSGPGNDEVMLDHATVTKGTIDLASGSNTVIIATSTFRGDLTVKTGNGDDVIDVAGAAVTGNKTIKSGSGNDVVQQ